MIRAFLVGVALLGALVVPGVSAEAVELPSVTQGQLDDSVSSLTLPVANLELPVSDVDSRSTDGDQTVVSLKSDVLFAFGKSDLSAAAKTKITGLVAEIAKNAAVKVYGYTDDIGSTASNRRLSEARARSVAAAIHAGRPDLRLSEKGFGEADPVAPNSSGGQDDPEGRAKNRRVEIRFAR